MNAAVQYLTQIILAGLIGGGLVGFIVRQWIQHRFNAALEDVRHQNNRDMEHVKHEFNTMLDRVARVHEEEFKVLPEVWARMQEAVGHTGVLVELETEWPVFERMPDAMFDEFVKKLDWEESEKDALRLAPDRAAYFRERLMIYEITDAREKAREFGRYLELNRIFLTADLYKKCLETSNYLFRVIEVMRPSDRRSIDRLADGREAHQAAVAVASEIGALIQAGLHDQQVK